MEREPFGQKGLYRRILTYLSEERGVSLDELPPLDDTVDVEALRLFLESSGNARTEVQYLGRQIHVEANGK